LCLLFHILLSKEDFENNVEVPEVNPDEKDVMISALLQQNVEQQAQIDSNLNRNIFLPFYTFVLPPVMNNSINVAISFCVLSIVNPDEKDVMISALLQQNVEQQAQIDSTQKDIATLMLL
jgi:apolipoprotein N-acyltransferase